ncbi:MAG: DUF5522 domain-containing protein [Chitinophagaceae bacterium]
MPFQSLEPEDYYFNGAGLLVLTQSYLIKRGSCCGNGCLHCPYPKQEIPVDKRSQKLPINQRDHERTPE